MHILQFKALFEIYKEKRKETSKILLHNTICIEYRSAITQHHNKGDLH